MQRVKPSTCLADVFNNEVAGVMLVKPFLILKWIMHLSKRHRTTLEPAVENFGNPAHHRLSSWVIWVWSHQVIDHRAMQFGDVDTKIALQVREAAVHIDARISGVITAPYGNW